MKVQAFILLFPLLTYFSETLRVPAIIQETSKKSSCCAKMKMMHMTGKMGCGKKHSNKNNPNDCSGMNCINCPLGYNSTTQAFISVTDPSYHIEKDYFNLEERLISDYFYKAWKPPKTV